VTDVGGGRGKNGGNGLKDFGKEGNGLEAVVE
jgi:hypothetical protein